MQINSYIFSSYLNNGYICIIIRISKNRLIFAEHCISMAHKKKNMKVKSKKLRDAQAELHASVSKLELDSFMKAILRAEKYIKDKNTNKN